MYACRRITQCYLLASNRKLLGYLYVSISPSAAAMVWVVTAHTCVLAPYLISCSICDKSAS